MDELERLLFDEARADLELELQGKLATIGTMQRLSPEGYQAARGVVEQLAAYVPSMLQSRLQAEKISAMLHSEDEGLSSIQEVLSMQPVNALTLAHLVRLERSRRAAFAANTRHQKSARVREENKEKLRQSWASGKFTTRDICAEEECQGLDMSYSTARKVLRKTPQPPSRS